MLTSLDTEISSLGYLMLENKSDEVINKQQSFIQGLLKKRKSIYKRENLLQNISTNSNLYLIELLLVNYLRICTSGINPLSKSDFLSDTNKFRDIDGFLSIVNTRINFHQILQHIKLIKEHPLVISFDDERYLSLVAEILNKNAFFEFSKTIYSTKYKSNIGYFDLKTYCEQIEALMYNPKNTIELSTITKVFAILEVESIQAFNDKISRLKDFSKKRNREKLLYNSFFDCISLDAKLTKIAITKITFPLFKYITVPVFMQGKKTLSDKQLMYVFRNHRKKIK